MIILEFCTQKPSTKFGVNLAPWTGSADWCSKIQVINLTDFACYYLGLYSRWTMDKTIFLCDYRDNPL